MQASALNPGGRERYDAARTMALDVLEGPNQLLPYMDICSILGMALEVLEGNSNAISTPF